MRERNVQIKFFLSPKEAEFIEKKMQEAGIRNKSAYLRKMALDGYIIRIDFTELQKFIDALSRIGNNLNQIAKVANTYGEVSMPVVHEFEAEAMKILYQAEKSIKWLYGK
ncbi:plasmid mobilization protein [Caproicibacter fermentans]|uniref:Plasmid mobilization relaxosome protein MobC n=1 Tax=Caproicibacter fermentans TaxID=2576756 RepID=A0A7G8TC54_9FIRM|nr:plasmid mobilization relaxosome protein MobC [Caproicibacter fermentans]QNK41195.1 plasmid mobilization relaxosome protein MobC [Caproicibacter fermentans]